jgi:hypothetical protein
MATDSSTRSGDWDSTSTWTNGVPTTADTAVITGGKHVTVDHADSAANVTVADRGELSLNGGVLTTGTVEVDGELSGHGMIAGAADGDGLIVAEGGTLEFQGAVGADNEGLVMRIDDGATLKLDGAVGGAETMLDGVSNTYIDFAGSGVLDLTGEGAGGSGEMAKFQATVENFDGDDKILVASSGQAGDKVHFNAKTDILTVTGADGSVLEQIQLDGDYSGMKFSLSENGGVDTITVSAICFYRGTMIRTPDGEKAVETLKAGDLVMTADGVAAPISWLGRQTISTVFSDPEKVWPIRIKAGALGENVPSRDLVLSPDHAVLVDGVLVHAGALVNGVSIVRQTAVPRVFTYYHVELDDHALILAENTPAETFIDHPQRLAFDNWDERQALHPFGKDTDEMPFARAKSSRQVPVHVRVALAARAQQLGLVAAKVA